MKIVHDPNRGRRKPAPKPPKPKTPEKAGE
jgi:hypothetical protein